MCLQGIAPPNYQEDTLVLLLPVVLCDSSGSYPSSWCFFLASLLELPVAGTATVTTHITPTTTNTAATTSTPIPPPPPPLSRRLKEPEGMPSPVLLFLLVS